MKKITINSNGKDDAIMTTTEEVKVPLGTEKENHLEIEKIKKEEKRIQNKED